MHYSAAMNGLAPPFPSLQQPPALLLAAGRGERMRPLTDTLPKPLLPVRGLALIDHHLHQLASAGFHQVLINLAYRGSQIEAHCGSGSRYGLAIHYSREGEAALETGGALRHALPWFAAQPFALIAADVFTDLPYARLAERLPDFAATTDLAQLVLVANPEHHPAGDFSLAGDRVRPRGAATLTYAGLALIKPQLIADYPEPRLTFPLREPLQHWLSLGRVAGWHYQGAWSDVGTPQRLHELNRQT